MLLHSCNDDIVSSAAAFGDDSYLILAQVLMLNAMRAAPAVRREICSKMTGLFMAVPFWMLDFGAAHNPGCSAQAGLDAFKVTSDTCVDLIGLSLQWVYLVVV